jgi:hypothetical protein
VLVFWLASTRPLGRPTAWGRPLAVLRLLAFSDLDLARWDACVAASPGAPPYTQAWWLAATAGRWRAVAELGPGGEYRSLLPLPLKWRPSGWVGYQPLFTQQLGLLLTEASQERDLAAYLAVVAEKCRYFYQQFPPASPPLGAVPPGFVVAERFTYHLGLGASHAELHQGYAADYRRRLRHHEAAASPLAVTPGLAVDELIQLFLSYRGAADTGLQPRHYAPLRRLAAAAQARGLAELYQVRHPASGDLLAGALFVRHAGGLIYLFAAASAAGRAAGAPLLLVDAAVRRHAGQPGQVLDFEGGSLPAIGRFFANFGARPVGYSTLTFTRKHSFSTWMRP